MAAIMSSRRTVLALFAAAFLLLPAEPVPAVTRGETIHAIVTSLGLPEWSGAKHFADLEPGHPYWRSVETASALGIIHPSERFYPDIEASRAEAVMFSMQAMGLRHEASILNDLDPVPWPGLPSYIVPYMTLAADLQPPPPPEFLSAPREPMTQRDLQSMKSWLRECTYRLRWSREFKGPDSVLTLLRENIGRPPSEWGLQSREFGSEKEAASAAETLRRMGLSVMIHELEWSWIVRIGPFQHYMEAWETMIKIPAPEMTVVPFTQSPSRAMFVAALRFDPAATPPRVVPAASISGKRLPLDIIADNSGAEGAINGGFFSGSRIVGSLVVDSRPLSGPYGERSAVGWKSDGSKIHFGRGKFKSTLSLGSLTVAVSTMNTPPPQGGVGIFTPDVWSYVTGAPADGWEVTVKGDTVSGVRHSSSSNHFVTREGFLIIARGQAGNLMKDIKEGTPVSVRVEWTDPGFRDLDNVLQAGPMLLKNGTTSADPEGFSSRTLSVPHPRSLVGSDGEYMWFVVIDGRDPWHSNGATIGETAAVATRLGLVNALNLDGGGSSSIWWKGRIVTSPPGGVIRPVPYALVF
jgi:hypothetical protein